MPDVQGQLPVEADILATPNRQIAFVTVLQHPELLGDDWVSNGAEAPVESLREPLSDDEYATVGAYALRGYVSGQQQDKDRLVVDGWALPAADYTVLPKGLTALSSHARAKTVRARMAQPVAGDSALLAGQRAGVHILSSRLAPLENYVGQLDEQLLAMKIIRREMQRPWMAHKSVRTWQNLLDTTVKQGFFSILEAASLQHDWDTDVVLPRLKKALVEQLFGPEKDLIKSRTFAWQDMLHVTRQYAQARRSMATKNITLIQARVRKVAAATASAPEEQPRLLQD